MAEQDAPSYNVSGAHGKSRHGVVAIDNRHGIVAIGNFDGVHRGHQALLARAAILARQESAPFVVLTFDPHPRRWFQSAAAPFLITQPDAKRALLQDSGADVVVTLPFDDVLSRLSATEFIQTILRDRLAAKHIVVGQNFVFGYGRQGHVETLMAHGFDVTALAPVTDGNGTVYSSTAVRDALQTGDMPRAASLLGRTWSVTGMVIAGHQRGRTIGFPTANIAWPDGLIHPAFGVYAVTVSLPDGRIVQGIANLGRRPTVALDAKQPLLEAHLFDFDGDLYGQSVEIAFKRFVRPEQVFASLDDLKTQIERDCQTGKKLMLT